MGRDRRADVRLREVGLPQSWIVISSVTAAALAAMSIPVEEAEHVEMDVGFDESRGDEAPLVDADVRRANAGRIGDACIPKNEIHGLLPCVCLSNRRRTGCQGPQSRKTAWIDGPAR
jgi:hypothetical protein